MERVSTKINWSINRRIAKEKNERKRERANTEIQTAIAGRINTIESVQTGTVILKIIMITWSERCVRTLQYSTELCVCCSHAWEQPTIGHLQQRQGSINDGLLSDREGGAGEEGSGRGGVGVDGGQNASPPYWWPVQRNAYVRVCECVCVCVCVCASI